MIWVRQVQFSFCSMTLYTHSLGITFSGDVFGEVSYALCQQHPSWNNTCHLTLACSSASPALMVSGLLYAFFLLWKKGNSVPGDLMEMPEDLIQDWYFSLRKKYKEIAFLRWILRCDHSTTDLSLLSSVLTINFMSKGRGKRMAI